MKKHLLTLSCFFLLTLTFGQKMDSIKYAHGYLYFHDFGIGEPVILLSGGPGFSCEKELSIAQKMSNYCRPIVLEQRGTGRSIPQPLDSTTINLQSAYDDLNVLLSHLHLSKVSIYGHSWAGITILGFATLYPQKVKSIILSGTATPDFGNYEYKRILLENREGRFGASEWAKNDALVEKFNSKTANRQDSIENRKMFAFQNIYNSNYVDSLFSILSISSFNERTNYWMNIDLMKQYKNIKSNLKECKAPVYAICGRQDPIAFMTYELKIQVPSTELYWIEYAAHYPFLERAEDFYKTLNAIIEKIKNYR